MRVNICTKFRFPTGAIVPACLILAVGLVLIRPVAGMGADNEPASIVRTYYTKVLDVFSKKDLSHDQLRSKLENLAHQVFTFQIMAQMSLGRNWRQLEAGQQKEFVDLFTKLLENTYFQKIESHLDQATSYTKDDLQVTGQTSFSSRKAEVNSKIAYEGKDVPVDYRFVKLSDGWKIYDVLVEGVSLVQNYRTQFKEMLNDKSVADFMQALRDKVHTRDTGGGQKS